MRRASCWPALIAAAIVVAAPVAHADEPVPPKARKLAERGRELHGRGDYAHAIVAFKEAYVIAPSPGLLFNLAQAYRLQGNCDDAAMMYRRYIAANPSPEARAIAEGHLATVERCVHKRALDLPMDESAPYLQAAPPPDPTAHLLADVTGPERRPRHLMRNVGYGVTATGAVMLAVAGVYGYRAVAASREVDRLHDAGAKWKEIEPIDQRGRDSQRTATLLGVGGGAAVATGVALIVFGRRVDHSIPIRVAPTDGGAKVSFKWKF